MAICAQCGAENPQGAKFCNECGARLVEAPAARDQRKTVTVVFCDVTGSTAMDTFPATHPRR
jgi:ribosomal protein L40E